MKLLILIVGILLLAGCSSRITCDQFATRGQAMEAYTKGARNLDGNHNGIPCEKLRP